MREIEYGEARYVSPTPLFPVSCLVADDGPEFAGVFMTEGDAFAQAQQWQTEYPDARKIVVYRPVAA